MPSSTLLQPGGRSHRLVVLLVLLLSFSSYRATDESDITCTQSGMCSVGKNQYFYGEIETSAGFKSALEAVSYKREVIVVSTAGAKYLEYLFQLHNQFKRLGIAHFLALSMKEEGCQAVNTVARGVKNISCGWDPSPQHPRSWGGGPHLWHLRWRFLARAARIGYNVMSLDSDYMILQDPYVFLKAPPMADASLLSVAETTVGMNGGFAYIQNTKADGPVAWLYHHVTETPLRWMDDDYAHTISLGKQKQGGGQCLTFDQSFLDDSLHSTMAGDHIMWRNALMSCTNEDWKTPSGTSRNDALKNQAKKIKENVTGISFPPPASWPPPKLPNHFSNLRVQTIRVPNNAANPFPDELGGKPYTTGGGKYSDAYFEQLRGDCPLEDTEKCPGFKDAKAEDAAAAANTTEQMAFVPQWFAGSVANLAHGLLTPLDGSRPRQAMFHFHVLTFVRDLWKPSVNKIYNGFDWKLSKFLHSDEQAAQGLLPGPYLMGASPSHVLAIHPSVDLSRAQDLKEWKRISIGLVQLALISGRALVYPDMPCKTKWVHHKNSPHGAEACSDPMQLLKLTDENMPYAARIEPHNPGNLKKEYRICSAFLCDQGCVGVPKKAGIHGMLNVEFEEWIAHDVDPTKAAPTSSNTLFEKSDHGSGPWGPLISQVDANEVKAELDKFKDEPLLYVNMPVVVEITDQMKSDGLPWIHQFKSQLLNCRGTYFEPYKIDQQGAGNFEDYVYGPHAMIKEGNLVQQVRPPGPPLRPWPPSNPPFPPSPPRSPSSPPHPPKVSKRTPAGERSKAFNDMVFRAALVSMSVVMGGVGVVVWIVICVRRRAGTGAAANT